VPTAPEQFVDARFVEGRVPVTWKEAAVGVLNTVTQS
jgi:hypothetical protein